jgi:hypothetical protein
MPRDCCERRECIQCFNFKCFALFTYTTCAAYHVSAPPELHTMKQAMLVLCLLCLAAAGANARALQHDRKLAKL